MNETALADAFDKYFYMILAGTAEARELAYRIRYEVYCREFQYEREEDCPGQIERDSFDEQSLHCLLMHRSTGSAAGCVRLICPHAGMVPLPLPFERFCGRLLDPGAYNPRALARSGHDRGPGPVLPSSWRRGGAFVLNSIPRDSFAEVSRLAVLSSFRRRQSDEKKPISLPDHTDCAATGRDSFPYIPVSLFLAGLSMFLNSEKRYAFAMMEPRLARMLRRFGIYFTQVGNVVDYHGQRGPFIYTRERAVAKLSPGVHGLLRLIDQQLSDGAYPPAMAARQAWRVSSRYRI